MGDKLSLHRWFRRCVFAAILLTCWASEARVIYVSPSGDDSTATPNVALRPFKSVKNASQQLRNGDTLQFARGLYNVAPGYPLPESAPIHLLSLTNVTLTGVGPVELFGPGPGCVIAIQYCSNIVVENLTFRGDRPDIPPPSEGPLFSTILLDGVNDSPTIRNCRFLSFGDHAISHLYGAKQSYNMVVTNCYFADGGDGEMEPLGEDGAAVSGISSGSRIVNNYIERCYRGIEIEGTYGISISNIIVEANVITNCYTMGIVLFGTSFEGDTYSDIRIRKNRIVNMKNDPGVSPYPRYGFSIWLSCGENVEITDNYIDGYWIYGGGISVMSSFRAARNVSVARNIVRNVKLRGIQIYQQDSYPLENIVVSDNTVDNTGEEGILLNGRDIRCERNSIQYWGLSLNKSAIQVDNESLGSTNIQILDNRLSASIGDRPGISIAKGAGASVLSGNVFGAFRSNSTGVINDHGVRTAIFPKITGIEAAPETSREIHATGAPGLVHTLQTATSMSHWLSFTNTICPNDGKMTFISPGTNTAARRFFRVTAKQN